MERKKGNERMGRKRKERKVRKGLPAEWFLKLVAYVSSGVAWEGG